MPADTLHQDGPGIGRARGFVQRLEIPADALLAIYFAVFARQYLWFLTGHNRIAWAIAVLTGVGLAGLYVWTKPREEITAKPRKFDLPFWVIVVLPLVICLRDARRFPRPVIRRLELSHHPCGKGDARLSFLAHRFLSYSRSI